MKLQQMVEMNNQLREQLTSENEYYYGEMLVYLRSSNASQKQVEELLLELLTHVLEAQKEGKSIKDVFGEDLTSYCDQLVRSLPKVTGVKRWIDLIWPGFIVLSTSLLIQSIVGLVTNNKVKMYGSDLGIYTVFGALYIFLVFRLLKESSFGLSAWKDRILVGLVLAGPFLLVGAQMVTRKVVIHEPYVEVTPLVGLGMSAICYLIFELVRRYHESRC